jgi:UMF1 family MFS transporter
MLLGIFVGPVQASSRSYLAKEAPPELMAQMFGFFTLSGKATSFMGPLVVSWTVATTGSLLLGMTSIIIFFIIGLTLLLTVKEPGKV